MKLADIIDKMGIEAKTGASNLEVDVQRGYSSDLLSDVIANAQEGDLWVTLQIHQNIVAVAVMKSLAGIILVNGREPEEATRKKAEEENIPIMVSKMSTFTLIGKLHEMGISGG